MSKYSDIENKVKDLIKKSLYRRIESLNNIDPDITHDALVDRWLSDIMAIGFNNYDLNNAALDIYEIQKPLEGLTISQVILEDIRGRVLLSDSRFSDEIEAFKQYFELRDSESEDVIIFKVKEELKHVGKGDFTIL